MAKFGEVLRAFRQASNDPDRLKRRLSQERLGELMGHEMGDLGFSGAAVSDWERGESRINAQDRNVLIALIQVLHKCGGLKTLPEANQFLEAGNYRVLDTAETQKISIEITNDVGVEPTKPREENPKSFIPFLFENFFSVSQKELQELIAKAEDGPPPSWPRVLAAFMRRITDRFSISIATIIWVWIWLIAWWLIAPSLRLPFADRDSALLALGKYVVGTLVIPLVIGSLVNTKDNAYWKQQEKADPILLRLYTYQGAGIGFILGYFFVFPLSLARYYLNLESTIWIEIAAVTLGLVLGNMAARVVPYNLWRAYGQLTLKDGGIFFLVALLGPMWGVFFFEYYSILLTPILGTLVILLAITISIVITSRQARKRT